MGDAPGLPSSHLITGVLTSREALPSELERWDKEWGESGRWEGLDLLLSRAWARSGAVPGSRCWQHCAWSADYSQSSLYSAALTKCPLTRGLHTPDIHLSQLWRLDILDQGASRFCVWWGSASSWFTDDIFSPHPHLEEGAWGSLWLPYKDANPILGAPPPWLHHPPKPLPPNTITSRVRCQPVHVRGHGHSDHSKHDQQLLVQGATC